MPLVTVKMLKSRERDLSLKRKLAAEITKTVAALLNVKPDAVSVLIEEYEKENWAEGGKLFAD